MFGLQVGILVVVAASVIVVTVASRRARNRNYPPCGRRCRILLATQGQKRCGADQPAVQPANWQPDADGDASNWGKCGRNCRAAWPPRGSLPTSAQQEVAKQLRSSMDALLQMRAKKSAKFIRPARTLFQSDANKLQTVLGSVKTRGMLGEIALEGILKDALPHDAYKTQYRFPSTGAAVDAIIHIGERMLCIDSKFPLEAYRRLVDTGDDAQRREFSTAVRKHADSIAEKYILPDENTFDYALMFVPSESVFYELIMTQNAKFEPLDEYCRSKRVYPVSPNTVCAIVGSIAMSLQGQKLEENARHLLANLSGLQKQLDSFAEVYGKLGTHLRNAQQNYEDADSTAEAGREIILEQDVARRAHRWRAEGAGTCFNRIDQSNFYDIALLIPLMDWSTHAFGGVTKMGEIELPR